MLSIVKFLRKINDIYMKNKLIRFGEKALAAVAMPGLAVVSDQNSGSIGVGLLITVLFWPITVPLLLVFSPVHEKYCQVFKEELK